MTNIKQPRNVTGYRVQEAPKLPDGCHNCKSRYYGMVNNITNQSVCACSKACCNPDSPSWCDEVDLLAICDLWEKTDKVVAEEPNKIKITRRIRLKRPIGSTEASDADTIDTTSIVTDSVRKLTIRIKRPDKE